MHKKLAVLTMLSAALSVVPAFADHHEGKADDAMKACQQMACCQDNMACCETGCCCCKGTQEKPAPQEDAKHEDHH